MSVEHRRKLQTALENKDIDFYLATNTADIRWLTGFRGVFDEEPAHLALITRSSLTAEPVLFTDTRYSAALRILDAENNWRILDERRPRSAYVADVISGISSSGKQAPLRIGIESNLRLDVYRALTKALGEQEGINFELVELVEFVRKLRSFKDAEEIELLKAAQAVTDAAFAHMLEFLRPGLTEREAACELEFFMRRSGATGLAFPSIVASAANSATPHSVPTERVFERGDLVLMDFGAKLDDYCSDMTRTVVLGKASEQQRAMHAAVLEAQTTVIAALKPGMRGLEAQALAEAVIAEHGFEGRLIHGLGHGLGIDIHELPILGSKVEAKVEVGHVVTVEPGVYLDGFGGVRIEDFGVITEQGFEDFTRSSHELIEL